VDYIGNNWVLPRSWRGPVGRLACPILPSRRSDSHQRHLAGTAYARRQPARWSASVGNHFCAERVATSACGGNFAGRIGHL